MYCIHCGKEVMEGFTHCRHCGKAQKPAPNADSVKQCSHCGSEKEGRYCTICGLDADGNKVEKAAPVTPQAKSSNPAFYTEYINKLKDIDFKGIFTKLKDNTIGDKNFIKDVSIYTGIAFAVGLILCFILQVLFLNSINKNVATVAELVPGGKGSFSLNALDIYQLSMQNTFKLTMKGSFLFASKTAMYLKLRAGILLLLLIPVLSFLAAGFKKYKDGSSTRDNLKFYTISAALFSVVLNIVSLFNRKTISASEDFFSLKVRASLKGAFPFFGGIILSFLLVLTIQVLLSIVIKKEKLSDLIGFFKGSMFSEGLSSFFKIVKYQSIFVASFFAMLILLGIVGVLGTPAKEAFREKFLYLFLPNIFLFLSMFSFGTPILISLGGQAIKINALGTAVNGTYIRTFYMLPISICLLVGTIVILYIATRNLSKSKFFTHLGVASGALAILNFFIQLFSRLYITTKGDFSGMGDVFDLFGSSGASSSLAIGRIFIGIPFLLAIIIPSALLFLVGTGNYFLREQDSFIKIVDSIEEFVKKNKKILFVSIPAFILIVTILSFNPPSFSFKSKKPENKFPDIYNPSAEINLKSDEVYSLYFGSKDSYLIQTSNKIYLYNQKKNNTDVIFSSDDDIYRSFPSPDKTKIAVCLFSPNGMDINVINLKGKILNQWNIAEIPSALNWSPDSKRIILEEDTNLLLTLKNSEIKPMDIPGERPVWKDKETILYLNEDSVYEFDIKSQKKTPVGKEGGRLLDIKGRVYLEKFQYDETDEDAKITLECINDGSQLALKGFVHSFFPNKEGTIYAIQEANDLEENSLVTTNLVEYKKDGNYRVVNSNVFYIFDIDPDTSNMLVTRSGSEDFFIINPNSGDWENLWLNVTYSLLSMKGSEK